MPVPMYPAFDCYGYSREETSYIRIFHASPNAPAVDVYANGVLLARNLQYRGFTEYLRVSPGAYTITVYPAGTQQSPVLGGNLSIPPRSIFTVAAIGMLPNIRLLLIPDPVMPLPANKVYVRFGHLSPNAPNVDVALSDGNRLFNNVGYPGVTGYVLLDPGTYVFEIRIAGTNQMVLYVPNITLIPNRFYSVYAIGLSGGNPPLQVVIPLDGNSYLHV